MTYSHHAASHTPRTHLCGNWNLCGNLCGNLCAPVTPSLVPPLVALPLFCVPASSFFFDSRYKWDHMYLSFSVWLISLSLQGPPILSQKARSPSFYGWAISRCICVVRFLHPSAHRWALRLRRYLGYCGYCCGELKGCMSLSELTFWFLLFSGKWEVELLDHMVVLFVIWGDLPHLGLVLPSSMGTTGTHSSRAPGMWPGQNEKHHECKLHPGVKTSPQENECTVAQCFCITHWHTILKCWVR